MNKFDEMTEYTVTTELKTPWWLKTLRFFRIKIKEKNLQYCLNMTDIILTILS